MDKGDMRKTCSEFGKTLITPSNLLKSITITPQRHRMLHTDYSMLFSDIYMAQHPILVNTSKDSRQGFWITELEDDSNFEVTESVCVKDVIIKQVRPDITPTFFSKERMGVDSLVASDDDKRFPSH